MIRLLRAIAGAVLERADRVLCEWANVTGPTWEDES